MKISMRLMLLLFLFVNCIGADDAPSSIETGIEYGNTNGETCDSDDPWEYPCKYPLVCKNKLCTCPLPLQIYVPEEGSCYSAIGGICRDSAGAYFPCVPGSTCSVKTRTCTCLPRHKGRRDGSACHPLKIHGEFCSEESDCDDFLNFNCSDGKCGCNNSTNAYNPELKKCTVLSGFECDLNKMNDCTENSHCSNISKSCVCNADYSVSKSGRCGRSFGASCGFNNITCSDVFSCVNGQCKCPDPYNQYYDPELNQCVSLVAGVPCINENSDGFLPCVKNAECAFVFDGDYGYSECRCTAGYLEDDRFCMEPFGASCNVKNPCAKPLECVNGICKCANLLTEYDAEKRKCVAHVGSRCEIGKTICVENAKCMEKWLGRMDHGMDRCVCGSQFKANPSRTVCH